MSAANDLDRWHDDGGAVPPEPRAALPVVRARAEGRHVRLEVDATTVASWSVVSETEARWQVEQINRLLEAQRVALVGDPFKETA